jgi:hypothetical protein
METQLTRLGTALNTRTPDVVERMMLRSSASSQTLDRVVEESFKEVGAVSTVAVARSPGGSSPSSPPSARRR